MCEKLVLSRTQSFAITITIRPKYFNLSIEDQLNKAEPDILTFLSDMNAHGIITTEITKNGNLHFHGTIDINLMNKYHKNIDFFCKDYFRFSKNIGFICVKPITDEVQWLQYILKDYDVTKDLLDRNPIRFNSNGKSFFEYDPNNHQYYSAEFLEKNANQKSEKQTDK